MVVFLGIALSSVQSFFEPLFLVLNKGSLILGLFDRLIPQVFFHVISVNRSVLLFIYLFILFSNIFCFSSVSFGYFPSFVGIDRLNGGH